MSSFAARTDAELRRELQELIAALDRRVPRIDQAGEASIAHDAAALRVKAVKRLTELVEQNDSVTSLARRRTAVPAESD